MFDISGSGKREGEVKVVHFKPDEVREKLLFAIQQLAASESKVRSVVT